jgi:hypothetical protein
MGTEEVRSSPMLPIHAETSRAYCLAGQLEPNGSTSFPLADGCPVDRVPVGRHVVDTQGDQVATSRMRRSSCNLARIDHTCPGRNGGFGPVSLPLFHAALRGPAIGDEGLLSFMVGVLLRGLPACDGRCQFGDFASASGLELP